MNFQDYIRQEGITLEQLSEKVSVLGKTLKRIFKGDSIPRKNTIKRIAQAFDFSEEELQILLDAPPLSDHVAGLVNDSLIILKSKGLSFKVKPGKPNVPIHKLIEQDFCGEFSYFPREFESLLKQADNQEQLNSLKDLLFYCTAFMIDRKTEIDIKTCSQIILSDGHNAWELRIFYQCQYRLLKVGRV